VKVPPLFASVLRSLFVHVHCDRRLHVVAEAAHTTSLAARTIDEHSDGRDHDDGVLVLSDELQARSCVYGKGAKHRN
jgi:hypothetical protein